MLFGCPLPSWTPAAPTAAAGSPADHVLVGSHPPTGAGDHRKQSSSRCLPAKQSETVLGWSRQKRTCKSLCLTSAEISACDEPPLWSARFVTKSKTLSPSLSTAITVSLPPCLGSLPTPTTCGPAVFPSELWLHVEAGGHWSFLTTCPRWSWTTRAYRDIKAELGLHPSENC